MKTYPYTEDNITHLSPWVTCDWKFDEIKDLLEGEEWEEDSDNSDQEIRQAFAGTCFSLYPSGKYYMPFACGNLDLCPFCNGKGKVRRRVKRRVWVKWLHEARRIRRKLFTLREEGRLTPKLAKPFHARLGRLEQLSGDVCPRCDGLGSHEAHDDEIWREFVEEELSKRGFFLLSGEGDPCDLFVGESREKADPEEKTESEGCATLTA